MTRDRRSLNRDLRALFDTGSIGEPADGSLLEQFRSSDSESAELAFSALVERHGPMVYHACCSILRDRHAAEDALQATFLVLARKAGTLWVRESLGPWLFGVACRVSKNSRKAAWRRRLHERRAAERVTSTAHDETGDDRDVALYEELSRLPERYRMAVVLCDMEGLTQDEAARQLGWPAGTVRSRLARARGRLRDRLTRRGLAPSVLPLGATLARPTAWELLTISKVENAVRIASAAAGASAMASSIALTEGMISMMFSNKLTLVCAVALTGGLLVGVPEMVGHPARGLAQEAPVGTKAPPANTAEAPGVPAALGQSGPNAWSPADLARLQISRQLRDTAYRLFSNGETDLVTYLTALRKYSEIVRAVGAKSDADLVRFYETQLVGFKQLEQVVRELHEKGQATSDQIRVIELERLEAENALAKAKAKISAGGAAVKARLAAAKKVRDAKLLRFKGGQIDAENFLNWQRRYDELAYMLMLITGGDRVRLLESQVAELKNVEQAAEALYRDGQVQEIEIDIVTYYRLEAEESLARERAGIGKQDRGLTHKE